MNLFLWLASLVGFAGKFADCWTTYQGVFLKKVAAEGDSFWLVRWTAKSPWTLLAVEPLAVAGLGILNALYLKGFWGLPVAGILIGLGVSSFVQSYRNSQINKGK